MPIQEVLDRASIVRLKIERGSVSKELEAEFRLLVNEMGTFSEDKRLPAEEQKQLESYFLELYEVNGLIWDLESDIRRGREDLLGLEEVGRRAINIRMLNDKRIEIKNEIGRLYSDGFQEVKIVTGGEDI